MKARIRENGEADPNADAKDQSEAALLRAMRRRLNGQERAVMDALGDPPDLNKLTPEFWQTQGGQMLADLRPQIERMTLAAIASAGTTVPIVWDEAVIAREAADWAARYAFELVRGINANTERLLRDQVRRFIETPGMTIGQLRAALAAAFGDVRAQMIAVTETTRAFAQGEAMVQQYLRRAGLEMRRYWNTSADERVCFLCGPLDGKPEGEWGCDGPPKHVRCILPGNLVLAPGGITAAAKSFYVGRAVEIVLCDGGSLTVTENHPVLTARGWVPAQFLNKGDKVVYSANPERIAATIDPDNNHMPTVIEQVFGALIETPGMAVASMPVAPEDLHGDGRGVNGYIDVVHPNGALLRDLQAMSAQGGSQLMLNGNSMVEPPLIRSGMLKHLIDRDSTAASGIMGIGEHSGALLRRGFGPADVHATRDIAGHDTGLQDALAEGPTIDASLAREFLLRFTSEITLKQVTEVRYFDTCSHVYDLQSDMFELYTCNGAVVKNCRCWTTLRLANE